jgi:hypothetical protein
MSERDLPPRERQSKDGEDEEDVHPLKAGIEAAKNGDTASLEDILSDLD